MKNIYERSKYGYYILDNNIFNFKHIYNRNSVQYKNTKNYINIDIFINQYISQYFIK